MELLVVVLAVMTVALAHRATHTDTDTVMVGSSVHETHVQPPGDQQEAAADQGYLRTHKTRGGDGYKHFDSFHNKDGDSYGYEKHSAYGKGGKGGDGGEYHESSSYSSDDGEAGEGGSGTQTQPKVWHYESRTGTPSDPCYDPETYEGDYTQVAPRTAHPDVEVVSPVGVQRYQVLRDARGARRSDPQVAGTEEEPEYDYYEGGSGETEGEESYEGDYEGGGDYEGEGDYYY